MGNIFFDSDVCLDLYLERKPFAKYATILFSHVERQKFRAVVSTLSFNNIFYVLNKHKSSQAAIKDLQNLRALVDAGKVDAKVLDLAVKSGWTDFEDAMQHFCAIEEGCEAIITRNTSDFKKSTLSVYTPAEFLETEGLI